MADAFSFAAGLFTRTVWVELGRCCCLLPNRHAKRKSKPIIASQSSGSHHNRNFNRTSMMQINRWTAKQHSNIELRHGHCQTALLNAEVTSGSQSDVPASSVAPQLVRKATPPHIAHGRGNKYKFENLLL
jgi:hypothetical protein